MLENQPVYQELKEGVIITWLTGISLSTVCLIAQLSLYYLKPDIRKIDQKILAQLSMARLLNTIMEYLNADVKHISNKSIVNTLLTTLYVQTDTALICWMFVYTKNLYDKVVRVFFQQNLSCLRMSLIIWLGSLPIGLLYPLTINIASAQQFQSVYNVIKFAFLLVNMLFFSKIFYVIAIKHSTNKKNLRGIMKSCLISFLLVCITSLQVALTDFLSFYIKSLTIAIVFCVINSYQVLAISIIFAILSKNSGNT